MFKEKVSIVLRCTLFLILFAVVFNLVSFVLIRKDNIGATACRIKVGGFTNLEKNSVDVMTFGSSHAYCSVNPLVLEEKYGISAYTLATQRQSVKLSYYYMKEALKTQSPKIVIYETFMVGIKPGDDDVGAILRSASEPMHASINKFNMLYDSVGLNENAIDYYLPVFKYHNRWSELTQNDFSASYKSEIDSYRGYVCLTAVKEQHSYEPLPEPTLTEIPEEDIIYLQKIQDLADEYGFTIIFMYVPFPVSTTFNNLNYTMQNYCAERGIDYINGYALRDAIGIDFATDFVDTEHLNTSGSEKVSSWLGAYLCDTYGDLLS